MRILLVFLWLMGFGPGLVTAQTDYFPPADLTGQWETTDPATLNWCQDSIDALYDFLALEQTRSFLLLKDGKIVLENYFGTFQQDSLHPWFSAGKSLRSVLLGIAEAEGSLSITDPASTYLGNGWTSLTPVQEDSITVRNLVSMTSGLNEIFFFCAQPACRIYRAPAGDRWVYHNSPYALTKDVLEAATGETLNSYTTTKIRQKIGMGFSFWLDTGPSQTFFYSKARDMARFGLLVQRAGRWNNEAVYPATDYFTDMLLPSQPMNPAYGYLWWLNGQESYIGPDSPISFPGVFSPAAPADVVLAAGANGQFISVSRETGLIMIRQGTSSDTSLAPTQLHDAIWARINALSCGPNTTVDPGIQPAVEVFPNPATNEINFATLRFETILRLYNSTGRFVHNLPNQPTIFVGDLPRGHYVITLSDGAENRSIKLLLH